MDTGSRAAIMDDTRASDFYRRAGFSTRIVRGRPRVQFSPDKVQIREEDLNPPDIVTLVVFPELTIRREPWRFWGVVTRKFNGAVVLRVLSGPEKGTLIRIPFRYFADGRVYMEVGISEDE